MTERMRSLRSFITRLKAWVYGVPYIAGGVDVVELNVTTVTELDSAIPELNLSKAPALVTA